MSVHWFRAVSSFLSYLNSFVINHSISRVPYFAQFAIAPVSRPVFWCCSVRSRFRNFRSIESPLSSRVCTVSVGFSSSSVALPVVFLFPMFFFWVYPFFLDLLAAHNSVAGLFDSVLFAINDLAMLFLPSCFRFRLLPLSRPCLLLCKYSRELAHFEFRRKYQAKQTVGITWIAQ